MFVQISLGSGLLIFCSLVHVAVIALGIPVLGWLGARLENRNAVGKTAALLTAGILIILTAHTVEVWLWAFAFELTGRLEDFEAAFYFATVTYTTLGYGDITLDPEARIFGSFAAITGLLTFGISTAFLISLLARMLPASVAD